VQVEQAEDFGKEVVLGQVTLCLVGVKWLEIFLGDKFPVHSFIDVVFFKESELHEI